MSISASLLPEFDHEMANTRRTLERVPEAKFGWKPHQKSPNMSWLATHLTVIPFWATMTIEKDAIDVSGSGPFSKELQSRTELLDQFDRHVAAARQAIASATDEQLMAKWTLSAGGKQIFSMPRVAVLRSFVMNHLIHHRAQLTVYLRLNDVPVPALYGPSADETTF
ncbi:MAG TPA: DinB family protein [Terriglobales bacterium]|nr:DinB family protein [Terriglobales bacterium]